MLLGFISLLLTVGQGIISNICISEKMGAKWHPCENKQETQLTEDEDEDEDSESNGRKLLMIMSDSGGSFRRILASAASTDKCAAKVCEIHDGSIFLYYIFFFSFQYGKYFHIETANRTQCST